MILEEKKLTKGGAYLWGKILSSQNMVSAKSLMLSKTGIGVVLSVGLRHKNSQSPGIQIWMMLPKWSKHQFAYHKKVAKFGTIHQVKMKMISI